jgi:hypothetical protein
MPKASTEPWGALFHLGPAGGSTQVPIFVLRSDSRPGAAE